MRVMIIIFLLASTLHQYGHYMQMSQQAQQHYAEEAEAMEELLTYETVVTEPVIDDDRNDYDVLIGEWSLYMAEMDGEMQYFDEDSSFDMKLEFNDDQTVYLYEFTDGVQTLFQDMDIEYDDIYVSFICDDPDILPADIAYEEYMVLFADDDFMYLYLMFYDDDDYLEGGYTLYFER
ncbi:MAG: hypothetical protein II760_01005 [Lachnospiraceae bacterium]|nr:hypothetical protein [Lachnospiraceae bacterium]